EDAGPPEVIDQIEEAGVPVFMVPEEDTVDGAFEKIRTIGAILGAEREADEIVDGIETDIEEARERAGEFSADDPVRVLFVYARGSGSVNASGHGTAAHAMIELAGAENAVDGYDGFRSLTPESAVEAEPDVLLFMDSGLASLGGEEGLSEIESLRLTPAYEEDRIASMDGTYLLGFGPRLGEAVGDLVVELQDVME
ncbi:MAG: hemin ABC transporter substrate-binding protein, partial [Spirochaetales bacterium]